MSITQHLDGRAGHTRTRCARPVPPPFSASLPIAPRRNTCLRASTLNPETVPALTPGPAAARAPSMARPVDYNQDLRQGHYEATLMQKQADKSDPEQPAMASLLEPLDPKALLDVLIVGCGPSGMMLAANVAKQGLSVGIVGRDACFTNNYGVWSDEFEQLGMADTLEVSFKDSVCYFAEGEETPVGRPYGRVCRRTLRAKLVGMCKEAGVKFLAGEVTDIATSADGNTSNVVVDGGSTLSARMVTLAAGGAAGKFLQYEEGAPPVAAQTAYGIEAEVEGYGDAYPADMMLFMDYRRHHTGVWDGTAARLQEGNHPNAGDGMWGTQHEAPSFLYAMPLGGNRVFLEETCLVARPTLPFAVLKRRLDRRLRAMGLQVKKIHEEEWSYIPVGGPLPVANQSVTAFGAAANLVHPATGFSIARSFREAPEMARHIAAALAKNQSVADSCTEVWEALWPQEKRRQASFHVFGMELLARLDLTATNQFFQTFFSLPPKYWKGFLASRLTSLELIAFAGLVFFIAPMAIKTRLVGHLVTDPSGKYLINTFTAELKQQQQQGADSPGSLAPSTAAVALMAQQQNATDKLGL